MMAVIIFHLSKSVVKISASYVTDQWKISCSRQASKEFLPIRLSDPSSHCMVEKRFPLTTIEQESLAARFFMSEINLVT